MGVVELSQTSIYQFFSISRKDNVDFEFFEAFEYNFISWNQIPSMG